MKDFNYREYSLSQLDNWVHDAITSTEASPQEIYDTIKKVVEEEYYNSKDRLSRSYELLALLNGNGKAVLDNSVISSNTEDKINKWILPVEVDAVSGEYYLQFPDDMLEQLGWKEGDTLEYIDNKDGTFRVRKVTKPIDPDEC